MTKRRKILLAAFGVLILLLGVLWAILAPKSDPEPSYGGKTVSEYLQLIYPKYSGIQPTNSSLLKQQNSQRLVALEALRHMDTNAVPTLVRALNYKTPPWRLKLHTILARFPARIFPATVTEDRMIWRKRAAEALLYWPATETLGTTGWGDPQVASRIQKANRLMGVICGATNQTAKEKAAEELLRLGQPYRNRLAEALRQELHQP